MKCTASIIALLFANSAFAVPSLRWRREYNNSTTPWHNTTGPSNTTFPTNSTTPSNTTISVGFILPKLLKNHDIPTNDNTEDVHTTTVRRGAAETSTLYEIDIPADLNGKTCNLVIKAGRLGRGDNILGTQAMDIFNNNIESLAEMENGNRRNVQLARVKFDRKHGRYLFDQTIIPPKIKEFPCPAGKTLEWESVAVGDFDINVIQQDFVVHGQHVPNGLSIAYYD